MLSRFRFFEGELHFDVVGFLILVDDLFVVMAVRFPVILVFSFGVTSDVGESRFYWKGGGGSKFPGHSPLMLKERDY